MLEPLMWRHEDHILQLISLEIDTSLSLSRSPSYACARANAHADPYADAYPIPVPAIPPSPLWLAANSRARQGPRTKRGLPGPPLGADHEAPCRRSDLRLRSVFIISNRKNSAWASQIL